MYYTSLPLKIEKGKGFCRQLSVTDSIKAFIDIIVSTPVGIFSADPDFGFVFRNFRFQNFNEEKGVLYSVEPDKEVSEFYKYKIQGQGVNFNTFAHELKISIEKYEPRLRDVKVSMEYSSVNRVIDIIVTGKASDDFEHKINMHVW